MSADPTVTSPSRPWAVGSTGRRLFAVMVDAVVCVGVNWLLAPDLIGRILVHLRSGMTSPEYWKLAVVSVPFFITSNAGCLHFFGATPGKWLVGLRVVSTRPGGDRPSWSQSFVRPSVAYLFCPFGTISYALAFFDPHRRHLADRLAQTRVIQTVPGLPHYDRRPYLAWALILLGLFNAPTNFKSMARIIEAARSGQPV